MTYAIILSAGKGERVGIDKPKQLLKIAGKTVLEHTLDVFETCEVVDRIVVVVAEEIKNYVEEVILPRYRKIQKIVIGGRTRRESSFIGLKALEAHDEDIVLIHDAVRPFVDCDIIKRSIEAAEKFGAADTVIETPDTIVKVDENEVVVEIPERKYLRKGQTPQAFKYSVILKAHEEAAKVKDIDEMVTDDCGLVLKFKTTHVKAVRGSDWNIKITYPIDIHIADKIFQIKNTNVFPNCREFSEKLFGKVLVVFGGTRGIGKSIVKLGQKAGMRVYGFSRSTAVDVRDLNSLGKALKEVEKIEGRIDYVVNTAGILKYGPLINRNYEEILEEIEINYIGTVNVILASYPYLSQSRGMILLFSSSSYTRGRANYSIYSSTKAAIVNLVQALSGEFHSIRINAIVPERTATPMRFENFGKEPQQTLLHPDTVALVSLEVLTHDITGAVFEIKKVFEGKIMSECKKWYSKND